MQKAETEIRIIRKELNNTYGNSKKSFALQYKDKIPNKLYKAIMSYEVLITD